MQRFLAATLAAGICVAAGLVSAAPAQAQTLHYGPGGGDGVEVWATPQAGGYQVEYNALCVYDGDTRYPGFLQIVGTDGDKTFVQGQVVGGATYTIVPASYFTPTQHYYSGTWDGGSRAELLNLNNDSPPPANNPPTVSITAPSGGTTYTAPASITITANAADSDGSVSKVEFYQGATKLGEDTSSAGGWTYSWTGVAAGSYSLTAKAFDDDGASTTSAAVSITVNPPANVAPTCSITRPSGGATYTAPATVSITASASDTDGTIAKVEFYQGATKLGEDTSSSGGWTYSWTGVAAGSYSLSAKAFDDDGASTTSAQVTITVLSDTDGDGLPDSWETTWGLDPNDPDSDDDSIEDPDDDEDGDGFTNYAEYLAGSDPTDPDSHPAASDGSSSSGISCAAGPFAASAFAAALLLAVLSCGLLLRRRTSRRA